MPAPAWAGDLLAALGLGTAEELEAYLKRGNNADRRIFQAARAPAIGWAAEVAPYPERGARVYSPGALRRWTLALPVYRSDQRQDGDYDAFGIRFKGNVDKDPTRDVFIRQRLKGMCICRFFFSNVGAVPAAQGGGSSSSSSGLTPKVTTTPHTPQNSSRPPTAARGRRRWRPPPSCWPTTAPACGGQRAWGLRRSGSGTPRNSGSRR